VLYVTNANQDPAIYQEKISKLLDDDPELFKAVSAITPESVFASNVDATPDWADSTSTSSNDTSDDDWFNNDDSGFSGGSKSNDDF
jgi:hypothetical protein